MYLTWRSRRRLKEVCVVGGAGFVAVGSDDSYESAQRALSQVVLQLRHLVNVWRNILPAHVYAKALGG